MDRFEWYYIQYMQKNNITGSATKEQRDHATEYALKMSKNEDMRHDREIGIVGISICILLMLYFTACFISAINGHPMR